MDIGVVIVTYNRINELKKAISCYENQTKLPKYIIIVNNYSSDGTMEFLKDWESIKTNFDKHVINLDENLGGSGGFYKGLEKSLNLDANWIWVADDDAYPEKDALQNIDKKYSEFKDDKNIVAICGAVINNGSIDTEHRRRIKPRKFYISEKSVSIDEYNKESFEIDLFSYVGTVLRKDSLIKYGLTEKDYFIYYDDTEHSLRLSRIGKIICIPSVKIIHNTNNETNNTINWKLYYGIRNRLHMYKKHFSKRYYIALYIRLKISMIKSKDSIYKKIVNSALIDSKNSTCGLHNVYRPGWKYTK